MRAARPRAEQPKANSATKAKFAKKAKPDRKTKSPKKAGKPKAERTNKKAEVIAMMKRAKGATLAEIVKATG